MKVTVLVRPRDGILDPQGQAIARALPTLGFDGVQAVRQGKRFELDVDDAPDADVLEQVRRMADTLLANPVIEDYEVRILR